MRTAVQIAKNTAFNFVTTASDVLVNLVIGIMLARSLGPEQYGLYALLMWFLGLAIVAVNLGLGEMVKRFVAESIGRQNADEPVRIVQMTLLLRGVAAVVASLAIFGFAGFWAGSFANPGDSAFFAVLSLALVPNVLNLAFVSIFAGFQKYEYGAYLLLGTNPLRAVLVVVLMVMGYGVMEVLLLNIGIWVLGCLIGLFLLRRLVPLGRIFSRQSVGRDITSNAMKYALVAAGITIVNYFLWQQAEILFVGIYLPVEEAGYYRLASQLPSLAMVLVPSVLGGVLLPAISEQFGRGDMERLRRIYITSARYLMMLSLPIVAAGVALAGPFIYVLYGADYEPVILLMQILFVPYAVRGISFAATSVIYGTGRPTYILKVGFVLILLDIGLAVLLIPRFGIVGAAIGSSIPRLLALPLFNAYASRKISTAWPLGDSLKIVLASCTMGAALFALQYYFSAPVAIGLAVPVSIIVYSVAILLFRGLREEDLQLFGVLRQYQPAPLRKNYGVFLGLAAKLGGIRPSGEE